MVQSLKMKEKRSAREELIYRALRADNNLYGIKLADIFVKTIRLNPDITFRENVIIRILDCPNDDLEFFEFDDIAEKILRFIERAKRNYRQHLLYKVYNKTSEDLQKIFSQRYTKQMRKKGKQLLYIEKLLEKGYKRINTYKFAVRGLDMNHYQYIDRTYKPTINHLSQVNCIFNDIETLNNNFKSLFFKDFMIKNGVKYEYSKFNKKYALKY